MPTEIRRADADDEADATSKTTRPGCRGLGLRDRARPSGAPLPWVFEIAMISHDEAPSASLGVGRTIGCGMELGFEARPCSARSPPTGGPSIARSRCRPAPSGAWSRRRPRRLAWRSRSAPWPSPCRDPAAEAAARAGCRSAGSGDPVGRLEEQAGRLEAQGLGDLLGGVGDVLRRDVGPSAWPPCSAISFSCKVPISARWLIAWSLLPVPRPTLTESSISSGHRLGSQLANCLPDQYFTGPAAARLMAR